MAFKFIIALACVAVASAGLIPTTQVVHAAQPVLAKSEESYDPHPQYQFSYSVNDAHTGDSKSQIETRDGDVVQGEYSLIDSDGHKRTVQYTADPVNGFNAVVNRQPLGQIVKTVASAPVAYAAPAVIKSAPLAYAAAPAYAAHGAYAQTYAAAPALIKSAPLAYAAAPAYAAQGAYAQTYAAAPALIKSAPLAYASHNAYTQSYAPTLVQSSPIPYSHAPAAYATQTLVKSSPVAYAAPAYAYHH